MSDYVLFKSVEQKVYGVLYLSCIYYSKTCDHLIRLFDSPTLENTFFIEYRMIMKHILKRLPFILMSGGKNPA